MTTSLQVFTQVTEEGILPQVTVESLAAKLARVTPVF